MNLVLSSGHRIWKRSVLIQIPKKGRQRMFGDMDSSQFSKTIKQFAIYSEGPASLSLFLSFF